MLLAPLKTSLEEQLVTLLASRPNSSAAALHAAVRSPHRPYSLQAVYKELRKLQSLGVVAKAGNAYVLSLPWLVRLNEFSHAAVRSYFDHGAQPTLVEAGERVSWRFSELSRADQFWVHLLLLLLAKAPDSALLQWVPHPWFHIVQNQLSAQYQLSLQASGRKAFMIVGGESKLDLYFQRFWSRRVYTWSFSKSPFEELRSEYLNVVGNFVLTIRLTTEKARAIDDFFAVHKTLKDADQRTLRATFLEPTPVKATLEHSPRKATRLRKIFTEYFAIPRANVSGKKAGLTRE